MPGSAIIGTNLVDSLLEDVVDGLRNSLHTEFGVRQFRVYTVLRTSSPDGFTFTDVETEITPQPLVGVPGEMDSLGSLTLEPCGIEESGSIVLQEVSLTYTEAELTGIFGGGSLAPNQQWLYKLTDAHGQGITDTYWVLSKRPFPDRISTIGWLVYLRRAF